MDPIKANFVVRDRVPDTAHLTVAGACLLGVVGCAYSWYTGDDKWSSTMLTGYSLGIFALLLIAGALSIITTIHFDIPNARYKKVLLITGLRFSSAWKTLPEVDYVSVFYQVCGGYSDNESTASYTYAVNLWYKSNRHFTIYNNPETGPCFQVARQIAAKLKVGLLDATEPDNSKWIEIPGMD